MFVFHCELLLQLCYFLLLSYCCLIFLLFFYEGNFVVVFQLFFLVFVFFSVKMSSELNLSTIFLSPRLSYIVPPIILFLLLAFSSSYSLSHPSISPLTVSPLPVSGLPFARLSPLNWINDLGCPASDSGGSVVNKQTGLINCSPWDFCNQRSILQHHRPGRR